MSEPEVLAPDPAAIPPTRFAQTMQLVCAPDLSQAAIVFDPGEDSQVVLILSPAAAEQVAVQFMQFVNAAKLKAERAKPQIIMPGANGWKM